MDRGGDARATSNSSLRRRFLPAADDMIAAVEIRALRHVPSQQLYYQVTYCRALLEEDTDG